MNTSEGIPVVNLSKCFFQCRNKYPSIKRFFSRKVSGHISRQTDVLRGWVGAR